MLPGYDDDVLLALKYRVFRVWLFSIIRLHIPVDTLYSKMDRKLPEVVATEFSVSYKVCFGWWATSDLSLTLDGKGKGR